MEKWRITYDWFLKLTPTQKNNLFSILIITALCFVIYYQTQEYKESYGRLHSDYNTLDRRCDSISFDYQKAINEVNLKRQEDLQRYSDKFETLFKETQQAKNEIR